MGSEMCIRDRHNSGGVNSYNWEGYSGGWKIFDGYLSDAQISLIYNNGNGLLT